MEALGEGTGWVSLWPRLLRRGPLTGSVWEGVVAYRGVSGSCPPEKLLSLVPLPVTIHLLLAAFSMLG